MNNLQYLIRNRYRKNSRKAVSPVISTIIIVAIAIAISIAVALYLTGITGQFTRFERLDITSAYADTPDALGFPIELTVKNSGTSVLTMDRVLINGRPVSIDVTWNGGSPAITLDGSGASGKIITMAQGDTGTAVLKLLIASGYKSGQSIELTFHTVSGKEYPKVVQLP